MGLSRPADGAGDDDAGSAAFPVHLYGDPERARLAYRHERKMA